MVVLRSILYAIVYYAVTALYLVLGSWLLAAPRSWAMKGLELHARTCVFLLDKICGTKLEVRGKEHLPKGACLVVAKHQSMWDTFALIPLLHDPAIVLKDELKWIPFYGWFCVKFQHILVKRDRAAVALKAMLRDAKDRASQGRHIVIFPEGTRAVPEPKETTSRATSRSTRPRTSRRAARPQFGSLLATPLDPALSRQHRRRVPGTPAARPAARRIQDADGGGAGGGFTAARR